VIDQSVLQVMALLLLLLLLLLALQPLVLLPLVVPAHLLVTLRVALVQTSEYSISYICIVPHVTLLCIANDGISLAYSE
jgi:hypothetical protein